MAGRVPTHIMLGLIVFLITLVSPGHSFTTKNSYYLSGQWKNFDIKVANDFCNFINGYLMEINSKEEYEIIRKMIMEKSPKESVFIGGNDIGHEGVWKWYNSGKNAMDNLQWAKGQPDNWEGQENCMTMSQWANFQLNDLGCHKTGRFLCEIPYIDIEQ